MLFCPYWQDVPWQQLEPFAHHRVLIGIVGLSLGIFQGFSEYVENKLNEKQVPVSGIFDTIDIDDIELEKMALA